MYDCAMNVRPHNGPRNRPQNWASSILLRDGFTTREIDFLSWKRPQNCHFCKIFPTNSLMHCKSKNTYRSEQARREIIYNPPNSLAYFYAALHPPPFRIIHLRMRNQVRLKLPTWLNSPFALPKSHIWLTPRLLDISAQFLCIWAYSPAREPQKPILITYS